MSARWSERTRAVAIGLAWLSTVAGLGAQTPTHAPSSAARPPRDARLEAAPPVPFAPSVPALGPQSTPRQIPAHRQPTAPAPLTEAAPPFAPGEVLLSWSLDARIDTTALLARARLPMTAIQRQTLEVLGLALWRLRFESDAQATEFLQWSRSTFPGVSADRNWRYDPQSEPRLFSQAQLGFDCRAGDRPRAPKARIGMLDTAVAPIEALKGTELVQRTFVSEGSQAPAHHGTAVAAAMSGQLKAPAFCAPATGATLIVAEVMEGAAQGKARTHTATVLPALEWVLQQGPHLMNLSLGGPGDALLKRAISRVHALGIPIVAAAGNAGPKAPPMYPAAYAGVIAVTALDAAERPFVNAATGDHILVGAPGVEVWLPTVGGGRYESGTSFAAPLVTGVLAQAMSANRLQPAEAAAWLCRHAKDLGPAGRDPVHGCGRLQGPPSSTH